LKAYLFYGTLFAILSGLILFLAYLSAGSLFIGFEELGLESPYFFASAFLGIGYGITALSIAYIQLILVRAFLDARVFKVPEICPECKENLYSSTVKWFEENRVGCPHCGVSLKVTKGWP